MPAEDEFLRNFAKEIASALREKEDGLSQQDKQNQPSIDDAVKDLYHSLVFDEPLIDHVQNLAVVSSALSRSLLAQPPTSSIPTSTKSFALSNRLVNGVVYLCNKNAIPVKQKESELPTGNASNPQSLNRNDSPSHSTVQLAMAKLAFCIFVDIPLQCCRDNSSAESNLKKIRQFLGSFQGDSNSKTPRHGHQDNIETTKDEPPKTEIHDEEKVDSLNHEVNPSDIIQQNGSEEIWAAESDPSDYDYGEADDPMNTNHWEQQEQLHDFDEDWLDPKVLSKPNPNLTLQQIRDAIGSLLQMASYTLLEPIFCLSEKETSSYVSRLTQLVLILLQPRKEKDNLTSPSSGDDSFLLDSSMDHAIMSPLWILRDAASYHSNNTIKRSTTSDYEKSYLHVLQTLLAMDQAYLQDVGRIATVATTRKEPDLCTSSIVGLSALSSWCAAQSKPTGATIDAVIDSMNDLDHVIERGCSIHKRNLRNTLIPVLETLTGIRYDQLNNKSVALASYYNGSIIPQTLLNSGLLRQILSLANIENDESNDDKPVLSDFLGFHHALWGLCIAYPKIVGKYVFRYTGSSLIIRAYATQLDSAVPQHCVQCILWNIYGWHQCKESSGSSGGLRSLRKPGSSSTIGSQKLTQDECSEVCQKAWARICQLVKQALNDLDTNDDARSEKVIEEWGRLLTLANIPFVADHFKSLVDKSLLDDVSVVISDQLTHKNGERDKQSRDDNKDDDKEDDKPSRKQKIALEAHKLLKNYYLFFQGTVSGSSKTD